MDSFHPQIPVKFFLLLENVRRRMNEQLEAEEESFAKIQSVGAP
jgi:hypothetical protein